MLTGDTSLSPIKMPIKCFPETGDIIDDDEDEPTIASVAETVADPVKLSN